MVEQRALSSRSVRVVDDRRCLHVNAARRRAHEAQALPSTARKGFADAAPGRSEMMLPLLGCPTLRREGEAAECDGGDWLAYGAPPLTAERSFGATTGRGKAWKMGAGFNTQPSRRLSIQMTVPGSVPLLPRRRFALKPAASETTLPPRTMDVWSGLQPRAERQADADPTTHQPPPPPPRPSMPLRATTPVGGNWADERPRHAGWSVVQVPAREGNSRRPRARSFPSSEGGTAAAAALSSHFWAERQSTPPPLTTQPPPRAHTADVTPGSLLLREAEDRESPAATETTAAVALLATRREAREAAAWRRLFRPPLSRARRPSGGAGYESSAVERSRGGGGDSRLEAERARPPTVRLGCCVGVALLRWRGMQG